MISDGNETLSVLIRTFCEQKCADSRAVYKRPLRLKLEAAEAFEMSKTAAENESRMRLREIMTDNTHERRWGNT